MTIQANRRTLLSGGTSGHGGRELGGVSPQPRWVAAEQEWAA